MEMLFSPAAVSPLRAILLAGVLSLGALPNLLSESGPDKEPYALASQFSVVETVQVDGGRSLVQHLYRDGEKLRLEIQEGPEMQIVVLRKDQKKIYTILPAQKLVLESAYRDTGSAANLGLPGESGASWEFQGKETMRGHPSTKYLVRGEPKSVYVWLDEAGQYPLRVAPVDGKTVIDWDQYQVGPQPSNLFEPPADFRTMSMNFPDRPR